MKRRVLIKLALLLLAGAMINVAVAWGAARPTAFGEWNQGKYTSFPGSMDAYFPDFRPITYKMSGSVFHWLRGAEYAGLTYGAAMQNQITRVRCGFPLFALAGEASRDLRSGVTSSHGAMVCRWPGFGERIIAFHPIWPGFAINTIFYAAVLWVVFAASFSWRRRIRITRGQCPSCGYSRRDNVSDQCPECGTMFQSVWQLLGFVDR